MIKERFRGENDKEEKRLKYFGKEADKEERHVVGVKVWSS